MNSGSKFWLCLLPYTPASLQSLLEIEVITSGLRYMPFLKVQRLEHSNSVIITINIPQSSKWCKANQQSFLHLFIHPYKGWTFCLCWHSIQSATYALCNVYLWYAFIGLLNTASYIIHFLVFFYSFTKSLSDT